MSDPVDDVMQARDFYLEVGGVDSDIGAREPEWYWRRAAKICRARAEVAASMLETLSTAIGRGDSHGTGESGGAGRATVKTASGRRWNLIHPRAEDFDLSDVACHLGKLARYNGGTIEFYSVAQHAVLVAAFVLAATSDPVLALWGLHHDDDEAYLGDMVGPLKRQPEMANFRLLGQRALRVITGCLELPWPEPDVVHIFDKRVGATEQCELRRPFLPEIVVDDHDSDLGRDRLETLDVDLASVGVISRGLPCWTWYEAADNYVRAHRHLEQLRATCQ